MGRSRTHSFLLGCLIFACLLGLSFSQYYYGTGNLPCAATYGGTVLQELDYSNPSGMTWSISITDQSIDSLKISFSHSESADDIGTLPKVILSGRYNTAPTHDTYDKQCKGKKSCSIKLDMTKTGNSSLYYVNLQYEGETDWSFSYIVSCKKQSSNTWIKNYPLVQSIAKGQDGGGGIPSAYPQPFFLRGDIYFFFTYFNGLYTLFYASDLNMSNEDGDIVLPVTMTGAPSQALVAATSVLFKDTDVYMFGGVQVSTANYYPKFNASDKFWHGTISFSLDDDYSDSQVWKTNIQWGNATTQNSPSPRFAHTMILNFNTIYLYGGYDQNQQPLNDFYTYDLSDSSWEQEERVPEYALGSPQFINHIAELLLFGYANGRVEVWSYQLALKRWTLKNPGNGGPNKPFGGFSVVTCQFDVFLFGGVDIEEVRKATDLTMFSFMDTTRHTQTNESSYNPVVYKYGLDSNKWTIFDTKGPSPTPRAFSGVIAYNNYIYVYGGYTPDQGPVSDGWTFQPGHSCMNHIPIAIIVVASLEGVLTLIAIFCLVKFKCRRNRRRCCR
eukprot:TRINITY_DN557_c0_g1_i2.p1 TRINITY_DN557_c0_g1~~TRINITY_DN557_c0_g1_i2.p1  ORF type:complete len:556 (-),score=52.84 TRINITY_DN557_c0_g1_i2:132-1799(-)